MMNKALTIYRIINLLSIDVAVGAMCSALFLGSVLQASISNISVLVLGLVVWVIYTADHLLDVKRLVKMGLPCSTPRHQFHQHHFKKLKLTLIVVCTLILILLVFLPFQIIITGIVLVGIVALYLVLNTFLSFGKEFIIAGGYVAGVLLPLALSPMQLLNKSLILLCFFITVIFNVFMFSYFDRHIDSIENRNSFVKQIGLRSVHFLFVIVFVLQLALAFVLIDTPQTPAAFLLIIMTGIMGVIILLKDRIGSDLGRILGEGVFLLLGFYWLLN